MPTPTNTTPETAIVISALPYTALMDLYLAPTATLWWRFDTLEIGYSLLGLVQPVPLLTGTLEPQLEVWTGTPGALVPYLYMVSYGSESMAVPTSPAVTAFYFSIKRAGIAAFTEQVQFDLVGGPTAAAPAESVIVSDDDGYYPAVVIDTATGQVLQSFPFPRGEYADRLPSGVSLWHDTDADTFVLFSPLFEVLATVTWAPLLHGFAPIAANGDRFYVGDDGNGTPLITAKVTTVSPTGVVGPTTWDLGTYGLKALAPTLDNTVLLYILGSYPIRRWDLVNNVALSDFAPRYDVASGGFVKDIRVLTDGTVVVGWARTPPAISELLHYTAAGTLIAAFNLAYPLNRLARSDDNLTTVWAWMFPIGGQYSVFQRIRVADGVVLSTATTPLSESGIVNPDVTVPTQGVSNSCPFMTTPVPLPPVTTFYDGGSFGPGPQPDEPEPWLPDCVNGAFPVDGDAVIPTPIKRKFHLRADLGAYTLTGTDAGLSKTGNRVLGAAPGDYHTTGAPAAFARSVPPEARTLLASPGSYAHTGVGAILGEPPTRTLLRVDDLHYLGNFKFPNVSAMVFAWGCFTGRRIDASTIRFYATGNRSYGVDEPLFSFDYPGTQTPYGPGMPATTVVQAFGPIWDGRRLVNEPGPNTHGLRWYDGRLWWIYSTPYEGSSNNPSLCCTELNETTGTWVSYGPWRAGGTTSPKFSGNFSPVPDWFRTATGCGPLFQIAGVHCANGATAWGMAAQIFTPPAHTAPTQIADNGPSGFPATPVTDSGIAYPFPRVTNFDVCGWNDVTQSGPGGVPSSYYCGAANEFSIAPHPANPTWGGGGMLLDWVDCGEWVDTGTLHGIVMFGQWVEHIPGNVYPGTDTRPHAWYGPGTCCHGHVAPAHMATGPATSSLASMVFIQDPDDYAAVLLAGRDPRTVLPAEVGLFGDIPDNEHQSTRTALYVFGSAWFDAQERLLFVSNRLAYNDGLGPIPVMHVYRVGPP